MSKYDENGIREEGEKNERGQWVGLCTRYKTNDNGHTEVKISEILYQTHPKIKIVQEKVEIKHYHDNGKLRFHQKNNISRDINFLHRKFIIRNDRFSRN